MKNLTVAGLVAGLTAAATAAHAQPAELRGSDTLFGVVTDAINTAGLDPVLRYVGGGSGGGETAMINGTQGIAPMSRPLSSSAIATLRNQGVEPVQSTIGLDAVSMWINAGSAVTSIDIPTIRSIYLCQTTDWSQVPAANGKTGPIVVYARNGLSGTTDTFKTLIGGLPATSNGNANWGACIHEVEQTTEIADATSNDPNAIGFAGLSAGRPQNRALEVAVNATSTAVPPTEDNIRAFSYPLSRRLFINSVSAGRTPSDNEQSLLDVMLDRSFLDPILTRNEFITCPATCP